MARTALGVLTVDLLSRAVAWMRWDLGRVPGVGERILDLRPLDTDFV